RCLARMSFRMSGSVRPANAMSPRPSSTPRLWDTARANASRAAPSVVRSVPSTSKSQASRSGRDMGLLAAVGCPRGHSGSFGEAARHASMGRDYRRPSQTPGDAVNDRTLFRSPLRTFVLLLGALAFAHASARAGAAKPASAPPAPLTFTADSTVEADD